jgi:hypothetical protein
MLTPFIKALIHANVPFQFEENPYFIEFVHELRPLYLLATRWKLSHSLLDSEAAHVKLEDTNRLKKFLCGTLLVDGWEDKLKHSLYGYVLARVKEYPVVLSLESFMRKCVTAERIFQGEIDAFSSMAISNDDIKKLLIAITTDNPTTMVAAQGKYVNRFPWILIWISLKLHQAHSTDKS